MMSQRRKVNPGNHPFYLLLPGGLRHQMGCWGRMMVNCSVRLLADAETQNTLRDFIKEFFSVFRCPDSPTGIIILSTDCRSRSVGVPPCPTTDGSSDGAFAPRRTSEWVLIGPLQWTRPLPCWSDFLRLRFSSSLSSIVNAPGEWTLRREFLRLQTEDREGGREGGHRGGGGGPQRQQAGSLLA